MLNRIIEVQNIKVNIDDNDYICISDFCKYKEGKSKADDIIRNWLRNRITLEFLGTWKSIYNPNLATNSNVRDYATINELTVLSNLESHNAELIKEGKSKEVRFEILSEIAKYQLDILNNAEK